MNLQATCTNRLCLRKSALAGSWSCVSGYLPGACELSLLSGRGGLRAALTLAAFMGFRESSLLPHLPELVHDIHACLRDVLLFSL